MALTILTGSSQAAATNYSYRTSGSADWSSVPTSSYFYDIIDRQVRYRMSNGDIQSLLTFPFTGSALITGSLDVTGSITASSVVSSFTGSLTGSVTNYETAWTSYTPVWTTDGVTQPVIGDGSITGAYKQIGKTVFVRVRLYYGTTTTSGTGTFYFSLPVTSSTSWGIQMPVSILDNGNAWYQAIANGEYGGFTTKTALIGQSAGGANSSQGITGVFPFTFGNLDSIQFNGTYEST